MAVDSAKLPLISIKEPFPTFDYLFYALRGRLFAAQDRYPMSTNSDYQPHDVAEDAYSQKTLIIGALTIMAVVAILYFASAS